MIGFIVGSWMLIGCSDGEPVSAVGVDDSGSSDTLPTETPRRVLHEMFTGSTCGPCLEADEILNVVLDANPDDVLSLIHI